MLSRDEFNILLYLKDNSYKNQRELSALFSVSLGCLTSAEIHISVKTIKLTKNQLLKNMDKNQDIVQYVIKILIQQLFLNSKLLRMVELLKIITWFTMKMVHLQIICGLRIKLACAIFILMAI